MQHPVLEIQWKDLNRRKIKPIIGRAFNKMYNLIQAIKLSRPIINVEKLLDRALMLLIMICIEVKKISIFLHSCIYITGQKRMELGKVLMHVSDYGFV